MTIKDIPAVDRALKKEFIAHNSPIIELIEAQTHDPFCVLVGTILSARTKDQCTAGAVRRLFATAKGAAFSPKDLERLDEEEIAKLIYPVGFDLPAICVDVHVHRICNRLGLIKTKTPLETEMTLRKILPVKYWKTWNSHLVSFGQTRCAPLRPKCDGCPIARYCPQYKPTK